MPFSPFVLSQCEKKGMKSKWSNILYLLMHTHTHTLLFHHYVRDIFILERTFHGKISIFPFTFSWLNQYKNI